MRDLEDVPVDRAADRRGVRGKVLGLAMYGCYLVAAFNVYTALFHVVFGTPTLSWGAVSAVAPRLLEGGLLVVIGLAFGMIVEMSRELELIA